MTSPGPTAEKKRADLDQTREAQDRIRLARAERDRELVEIEDEARKKREFVDHIFAIVLREARDQGVSMNSIVAAAGISRQRIHQLMQENL